MRRFRYLSLLSVLASVLALSAMPSRAMDIVKQGDQLIMTGPVDETDYVRFNSLIDANIKTVVLRNSVGGDLWTGMALGRTIKWRGLTTVASGYCFSSCALMFLGGKERYFSNEFAASKTLVGIHSPYCKTGGGVHPSVRAQAFRWIKEQTDGKFDSAAVERYESELGDPNGGVLFFADAPAGHSAHVLRCKGGVTPSTCADAPEMTAESAGFVTRTDLFAMASDAVAEEPTRLAANGVSGTYDSDPTSVRAYVGMVTLSAAQ